MPRDKIYPRHKDDEGKTWLVLLEISTFDGLEISDEFDDETLDELAKLLHNMFGVCSEWWKIETGNDLRFFENEAKQTQMWCIEESRDNSANFSWLASKARKYHDKIMARANSLTEIVHEARTAPGR